MASNNRIKVAIVDDHQMIIDGLLSLLESVSEIKIIASAENGKEALEIFKSTIPDVMLMDIEMPFMNGIDATDQIKKLYPSVKIIALSSYDEKSIVEKMMEAGAHGYILKNVKKEELVSAIKTVYNDKLYFSNEITVAIAKPSANEILNKPHQKMRTPLSSREQEVLQLVAQGLSNTQISKKLFISDKTVNTHRTSLMRKLEVHNVAELIRVAIHFKLI